MHVDQLNIVVDDVVAAVAFYERLGFTAAPIDPDWADWAPHHQSLRSPDGIDIDVDSVAYAREWGGIDGPEVVVGLRVETREAVDALYEQMGGGPKPPYDASWGARYAVGRDPSGTAVGIMSPADPERRSAARLPPD